MRLIILIAGLILLPFLTLQAQLNVYTPVPGDIVKVIMANGERYVGEFVEQGIEHVVLNTSVATIELKVDEVRIIKRAKNKGSMDDPYLHSSHYFFSPTSIPQKQKETYYQTSYGLLQTIDFGVTNHFSIRGGFELITLVVKDRFRDQRDPLWYLNPKVGVKLTQDMHIGGGVIFVNIPFTGFSGYYYGAITFGGQEANLTFNIGDSLFNGKIDDRLLYGFSAMKRVNTRLVMMTENYFVPSSSSSFIGDTLLGLQGIRYFVGKNAFDFSIILAYATGSDYFAPPIPYVGYSRKF